MMGRRQPLIALIFVACFCLNSFRILVTEAKVVLRTRSSLHDGSVTPLGSLSGSHHEGYDSKHELKVSIESKQPHKIDHDSRDDEDHENSDVCEAEDDDDEDGDSNESDGDSDDSDTGCDLLVVDEDESVTEGSKDQRTGIEGHADNVTSRIKDHREANDVESKQKKNIRIPDKLQVSLKTW